jgi:hypothetical protein
MRAARAVLILAAVAACTDAPPPSLKRDVPPAGQAATPTRAQLPVRAAVMEARRGDPRSPMIPAQQAALQLLPAAIPTAPPTATPAARARRVPLRAGPTLTPSRGVSPPKAETWTTGTRTTPVVASAEPNSVRVVAIPVPAAVHGHAAGFQFEHQSDYPIFGRLEGTVTAEDAARPIALSITVPPDAPAGRAVVGIMHFSCAAGCDPVDVPVVLDVAAHYALRLDPARALSGARPDSRIRTAVAVTNTGNAPASVALTVQVPRDWTARLDPPQSLQLAAGASATVTAQVTISRHAGVGDYPVEFRAVTTSGGEPATAFSQVRVEAGPAGTPAGSPVLVANAAMAQDGQGQTLPAVSGDLNGEVWPGVRAVGHVAFMNRYAMRTTLGAQSFERLGASSARSYLRLDGRGWDAAAGNVGFTTPGVGGTSIWGTGGTFNAIDSAWKGSAVAVRSPFGGQYLLGRAAHHFDGFWGGAMVSDLRDDMGSGRMARTVAADMLVPWGQGAFELQAGGRSTDQASGAAFLASVAQRTHDWSFNASASHIPGGSAAFAGAQDAATVYAFRRLSGRLTAGAGYWRNSDPAASGHAGMQSTGWSVSPQVDLGSAGTLSIAATGSQWTTDVPLGSFGNADRDLRATWFGRLGPFQAQAGASGGTLQRSGALTSSVAYHTTAPQVMLFGSVGTENRAGVWGLDASSAFTGEGVGVPARQLSVAGSVDQVPLIGNRVTGRARIMTAHLSGSNITSLTQMLGVEIGLGHGYSLGLDAERSDERRDLSGRPLWVMATRLRRVLGVPSAGSRALRGVVYADLNNNGQQDPGEPGVPSVIVDVAGHAVTTNGSGRFPFDPVRGAAPQVDPRSLAAGWIAAPRDADDASPRGALAVIPTTAVNVTLVVARGGSLDAAAVRLDRAVIVLTDSTGRRWTGAPSAAGLLHFDALPPGLYTVSADLSGVGERLSLPETLPTVRVDGGTRPIPVTLEVRPRAIKVFIPGGGGVTTIHTGNGGGSRPASGGGSGGGHR